MGTISNAVDSIDFDHGSTSCALLVIAAIHKWNADSHRERCVQYGSPFTLLKARSTYQPSSLWRWAVLKLSRG
ncbi:hypothetical protein FA13DRAFT_1728725 [Coprinellus micaceus]|uniref:Uncharacterized protein n=1 Tax=Coprinellus micaceus TaxID=71717 RepID=A0A4Y7TL82_COPMI|nr:hypothetical protein FA13DRAFT_1728725 [Coprinellus micaceus]